MSTVQPIDKELTTPGPNTTQAKDARRRESDFLPSPRGTSKQASQPAMEEDTGAAGGPSKYIKLIRCVRLEWIVFVERGLRHLCP